MTTGRSPPSNVRSDTGFQYPSVFSALRWSTRKSAPCAFTRVLVERFPQGKVAICHHYRPFQVDRVRQPGTSGKADVWRPFKDSFSSSESKLSWIKVTVPANSAESEPAWQSRAHRLNLDRQRRDQARDRSCWRSAAASDVGTRAGCPALQHVHDVWTIDKNHLHGFDRMHTWMALPRVPRRMALVREAPDCLVSGAASPKLPSPYSAAPPPAAIPPLPLSGHSGRPESHSRTCDPHPVMKAHCGSTEKGQ
jgi:hypothetical protein